MSIEARRVSTPGRAAVLGSHVASGAPHMLGIGGFYVVVLIFFTFAAEHFFSFTNGVNILSNVSVIGVVSIGQALVLISGGFDLSVSGTVPLGAVVYTEVSNSGMGVFESSLVAVAAGSVVGLGNGLIITKMQINPLVTTLATLSITGGLAFTISDGLTIPLLNPDAAPLGEIYFEVPLYVWTLVGISIVAALVLRYSVFGRTLYAIGGNREASRLAGIRVELTTVLVYVLSGMLSSFAGVMIAHQLLAGAPTVGGDAALTSITAVILGGASLMGGTGGIPGTLVGVLILGTIANGMALMQVPSFYQQIATGVLLLSAVSFGTLRALIASRTARRRARLAVSASRPPEESPPH